MERPNIIGKRFGRLTVKEFLGVNKHVNRMFRCICECGNETVVSISHLNAGSTRSCGCFQRDTNNLGFRMTTHGMCESSEYLSWSKMKSRCNPNNKDIESKRYRDNGISFCKRWNKFENFLADMGKKPTPKHTLDRIDNEGNYKPSNCRWATRKEQCRNTSRNVFLKFKGENKTISEWAEKLNIKYKTLSSRLCKGWSVERTLSTPVNR